MHKNLTIILIATVFIIVKNWKQQISNNGGGWSNKLFYLYTIEFLLTIKEWCCRRIFNKLKQGNSLHYVKKAEYRTL